MYTYFCIHGKAVSQPQENVADKARHATADDASQTSHTLVAAFLSSSALSMTCSNAKVHVGCCKIQCRMECWTVEVLTLSTRSNKGVVGDSVGSASLLVHFIE